MGTHIRNFYEDNVISVTSLVLRTPSVSAVFCSPRKHV